MDLITGCELLLLWIPGASNPPPLPKKPWRTPCPSLPSLPPLSSFSSPPNSLHFPSLPFLSLLLEVCRTSSNPVRGSVECGALSYWAPPAGSGAEPQSKLNLVHLALKYDIWWQELQLFSWESTDQIQILSPQLPYCCPTPEDFGNVFCVAGGALRPSLMNPTRYWPMNLVAVWPSRFVDLLTHDPWPLSHRQLWLTVQKSAVKQHSVTICCKCCTSINQATNLYFRH